MPAAHLFGTADTPRRSRPRAVGFERRIASQGVMPAPSQPGYFQKTTANTGPLFTCDHSSEWITASTSVSPRSLMFERSEARPFPPSHLNNFATRSSYFRWRVQVDRKQLISRLLAKARKIPRLRAMDRRLGNVQTDMGNGGRTQTKGSGTGKAQRETHPKARP